MSAMETAVYPKIQYERLKLEKDTVTMQTEEELIDKDLRTTEMGNSEIIIAVLYARVDNKLNKVEALATGFFNGVLKSLLVRKPFFADSAPLSMELSVTQAVIELKELESELVKIISMSPSADQSSTIATFIEAFNRLSVCTKINVAHLIYGSLLAESRQKSSRVRSQIAEQILRIEALSPGFGKEVIPILWRGGQEDDGDGPNTMFRPPQDHVDTLDQFSSDLEQLVALLENGETGNVAQKFTSLYTALPAGAREMSLDILGVVGEDLVGADTLSALTE